MNATTTNDITIDTRVTRMIDALCDDCRHAIVVLDLDFAFAHDNCGGFPNYSA